MPTPAVAHAPDAPDLCGHSSAHDPHASRRCRAQVRAADASSLTRDEIEHMESLEVENSGEIEMNGIMYAIERMGEHWEVLTSARHAGDVVMTGSREEDTRVYKGFRSRFPTMSLESITEDQLKDTRYERDRYRNPSGVDPGWSILGGLRVAGAGCTRRGATTWVSRRAGCRSTT